MYLDAESWYIIFVAQIIVDLFYNFILHFIFPSSTSSSPLSFSSIVRP